VPSDTPTNKTTTSNTTTNPDGSTTKTDTTTTTNRDGSQTTNTKNTTTNPDGSQTGSENTTTGNKPGGGAGKDDSSDGAKSDFCKQNPTLAACKNSAVVTDCAALSCEGDAIQCAIFRQQQKEYCELTAQNAISTLGQNMMNGNDSMKDQFPTPANGHVVNMPSTLNQSGFLGGGACFSDFHFTVSGQSFSIPFSLLCQYLIALRGLVMLLATLTSWRLISKSILG
jgi:hypothetical protein